VLCPGEEGGGRRGLRSNDRDAMEKRRRKRGKKLRVKSDPFPTPSAIKSEKEENIGLKGKKAPLKMEMSHLGGSERREKKSLAEKPHIIPILRGDNQNINKSERQEKMKIRPKLYYHFEKERPK